MVEELCRWYCQVNHINQQAQKDFDEKVARRQAQQKAGQKPRGREPKAPKAGPQTKDQNNQTMNNHASCPAEIASYKTISVLSDGLACITGTKNAGYGHSSIVVGNSKDVKKTVAFKWENIILGNLKTALVDTFHKLSNKHLPRHLATFQYRFNRRYRLKDMILRLTYMAARTPPINARKALKAS